MSKLFLAFQAGLQGSGQQRQSTLLDKGPVGLTATAGTARGFDWRERDLAAVFSHESRVSHRDQSRCITKLELHRHSTMDSYNKFLAENVLTEDKVVRDLGLSRKILPRLTSNVRSLIGF
jgi:hypothetical protein